MADPKYNKGKFDFEPGVVVKPCPFCGSNQVTGSEHEGVFPYLICGRCGGVGGWAKDRAEAIANWNKRA